MLIKTIIILVLAISISFSGESEQPGKIPTSTQSILNKAEMVVQKNRTTYDSANEKCFNDIEKLLKSELEKFTKAGKLDEALAVKKVIESFRTDIVSKVDESSKKSNNEDMLGENIKYDILGKWNVIGIWSGIIELKENGIVIGLHNNTTGKWNIIDNKLSLSWTHFNGGEIYDLSIFKPTNTELTGTHKNNITGITGNIKLLRQK